MKPHQPPKIGVVLANLGTPDQPTPKAVKRYLKQFLSDQRVIELPKFLWQIILRLFVIPLRSKRVAHAYEQIWQGDSPMRQILNQQCQLLQNRFNEQPEGLPVIVAAAMSYGNPSVDLAMSQLKEQGADTVVVLPLFPQFSATSTGALNDAVTRHLQSVRNIPAVSLLKDYFAHPSYIDALAQSVKNHWSAHGKAEVLLMSFHGIPKPYEDKGDPYARRCRCTAAQLAHALELTESEWTACFQSRFGKQEWVKPYTSETLKQLAEKGVKHVQIISPAFSADCLETLEELEVENKALFVQAGGERFEYIKALNTESSHIDLIERVVRPHVQAYAQQLEHWR